MMRPNAPQTIGAVIQRLATHTMPALGDEYAAADVGLVAMLLTACAREAESGVHNRMVDLEEMQDLFADAAALEDLPEELAGAVQQAKSLKPQTLRLSDVASAHDTATQNLIDLHAWVELQPGSAHTQLNESIWRYLARSAERHVLEAPAG